MLAEQNVVGRPGPTRAVAAAVTTATSAVLPLFLVGALAVQIRAELDFGASGLGAVASIFFAMSGVFAPWTGRAADRWGWPLACRIAVASSALTLVLIAAVPRSWLGLTLCLVSGAPAYSLGMSAANLALMRAVREGSRGLAFGLKQATVPLAGLIAGASVPAVGLTVGWRWAFVGTAVLALTSLSVMPRVASGVVPTTGAVPGGQALPLGTMRLVTVAGGVASATVSTITAFLVSSLVAGGIDPGRAGLMLAVGSAVGIAMRVIVGWAADRHDRVGFAGVAMMLSVGTVGFAMLASSLPGVLLAGTLLAFGAGWGWPGLYHFAVSEHNRAAPAAATGRVMVGLSVGAAVGPMLFGLVVEGTSYRVAWLATASVALLAAVIAFRADVSVRRTA